MANTVLPLSSDIYLEVDGKKVAVVQSYTTRATRTSREIEAFGENEPVATIAGANKYTLELSACTRRMRPSATASTSMI